MDQWELHSKKGWKWNKNHWTVFRLALTGSLNVLIFYLWAIFLFKWEHKKVSVYWMKWRQMFGSNVRFSVEVNVSQKGEVSTSRLFGAGMSGLAAHWHRRSVTTSHQPVSNPSVPVRHRVLCSSLASCFGTTPRAGSLTTGLSCDNSPESSTDSLVISSNLCYTVGMTFKRLRPHCYSPVLLVS